MKRTQAVIAASLLAPAVALAFETVDSLPWPSSGRFPAYPAETARPTDLWVQGGLMHDTNILRRESARDDDTVARLGAGFRHRQRVVGRQTLIVDARADYYSFDRFDHLDHLAYSGLADWRWEIGNNLSGSVILGRDRRLADLSESSAEVRSMVTTTRIGASGGYLITPRLRLRGGASAVNAERTFRADAETRSASVNAGAEYVSPLGNSVGFDVRRAEGDARITEEVLPGAFVNNDFTEREVALVARYAPGTQLRSDARIGRTKRTYNDIPDRDFEGTTWRALVEWLPGNKTILGLTAYKEPRSIIDIAASHVVSRGLIFGPSWAATSKLVFSGSLFRESRKFEGDPAIFLTGAPVRDEVIRGVRLGMGWEPARHWQAGFAIDRGERESNFADREYQFTALTGNLAWRW